MFVVQRHYEKMKNTTLKEYDPALFVIGKDMRYNAQVPEFIYNEIECHKFIQIIGQVSMRQNVPKVYPNVSNSVPLIVGTNPADELA